MNEPVRLRLPPVIKEPIDARDKVKKHYEYPGVEFTLDGTLVGTSVRS